MNNKLLQQVFDKVLTHLRKQGQPSIGPLGCLYRTEQKGKVLKCAVGCLIPKKDYQKLFEDNPVRDLIDGYGYTNKWINTNTIELLSVLQVIHDQDFYNLEVRFKKVAKEFNLKYTKPNKK
jgi:hypothetical protein